MDVTPLSDVELSNNTIHHLNGHDWTIDDNGLSQDLPLDHGWQLCPRASLGDSDRLPDEILCRIFVQLDLQSLTDFRRVNQRAMQVVDSIPEYATIVKHAVDTLRALLAVEAASGASCQELYDLLCVYYRCSTCNRFGDHLYLMTLKRVCSYCFNRKPAFLPLRPHEARIYYDLTPEQLSSVPHIRTIPGCYTGRMKKCSRRQTLYDRTAASHASVTIQGSEEDMHTTVKNIQDAQLTRYLNRLNVWQEHGELGRRPRRPQLTFEWGSNPIPEQERFMGVVHFPYLNMITKNLERGFRCRKCENKREPPPTSLLDRETFNMWTLKEHMTVCEGDL